MGRCGNKDRNCVAKVNTFGEYILMKQRLNVHIHYCLPNTSRIEILKLKRHTADTRNYFKNREIRLRTNTIQRMTERVRNKKRKWWKMNKTQHQMRG